VIYLASEKLHSYDYFTRWKLTHGLFGGPWGLGALGPGPAAHWIRRPWVWHWKRYGSLKFGMAAPYQSDEIWAVDSQENH